MVSIMVEMQLINEGSVQKVALRTFKRNSIKEDMQKMNIENIN